MLCFSKEQQQYEPYTEEELAQLDKMLHSEEPRRPIELSESLNDKTFIEEREQDEFMATLKDQFFEDNTLAMKGASDIGKLLRDNIYPKMDRCFLHLKAKSESFGKKKQIIPH